MKQFTFDELLAEVQDRAEKPGECREGYSLLAKEMTTEDSDLVAEVLDDLKNDNLVFAHNTASYFKTDTLKSIVEAYVLSAALATIKHVHIDPDSIFRALYRADVDVESYGTRNFRHIVGRYIADYDAEPEIYWCDGIAEDGNTVIFEDCNAGVCSLDIYELREGLNGIVDPELLWYK